MSRSLFLPARGLLCALATILLVAVTLPASAIVVDFNSLAPGTVVSGDLPGGGTAPGDLFPMMKLTAVNTGGGPHSLIIFDSSSPTGGDWDLGTPNQDFGGPGVGNGGEAGQPGENNSSYGHLLIVAEDIADHDNDGLVDDPDDEEGGGSIQFIEFTEPLAVHRMVLVDIDGNESATIECYNGGILVGVSSAAALGNNSVQEISLAHHGAVTRVVLTISNSGALAEIEYEGATPVEHTTWGAFKSHYK